MPSLHYTRPFVYKYQEKILNSKARFTVTEASTKVGKTASHIIWLFEKMLNCKDGQSVWWVAPVHGQAKIAYERMKRQVEDRLGATFFKANDTDKTLTAPWGAIIQFKSAEKPDNLYGDDVYAAVFDEFTRAREAAWWALRSTLTYTKGECKFIGNVKGKKNWGYKLATKARVDGLSGDGSNKDWEYFKITCWDAVAAGCLDKEEVFAAERDLPDYVFRELYEAEPSEDATNPFGLSFISACTWPASTKPPHVHGIDIAKKNDYFVTISLDKLGCVCGMNRMHRIDWHTVKNTIFGLAKKPMAIDATGSGDQIVEEISKQRSNVEGYVFSQTSKQMLMEGLAFAIQNKLISFPEGVIKEELESFEFSYTRTGGVKYTAPEGMHDDCVCALALAWYMYNRYKNSGNYNLLGSKTMGVCVPLGVILAALAA